MFNIFLSFNLYLEVDSGYFLAVVFYFQQEVHRKFSVFDLSLLSHGPTVGSENRVIAP